MGFSKIKNDSPNRITEEGRKISIRIDKTGPSTARISWNIPDLEDCVNGIRTYNGIIITIDTTPTNVSKIPINGVIYSGDATADVILHAGDKLGTSLIIGSFYNDVETTFLDVTDLTPNVAYYVSGFPVDNVNRYYIEGVHSYSLAMGQTGGIDTNGYQEVQIGVSGTDNTGLNPLSTYSFNLFTDCDKCEDHKITLNILGSDATTYNDLLATINEIIALNDSPYQGTTPPNTNGYYFNGTQLFQWDGYQNIELDVIVNATAPNSVIDGDYWYDENDDILYVRNLGIWIPVPFIVFSNSPNVLECDNFWFDGSVVRKWNGTIWVPQTLYNQSIDPSLASVLTCADYWYDETNQMLFEWSEEKLEWEQHNVILFSTNPNTPGVNTYWFDDNDALLFQWDGLAWQPLSVTVSITAPSTPVLNDYWFNSSLDELNQWDGLAWQQLDVIIWNEDPVIGLVSNDLWWNLTTDQLNVWDDITNNWILVSSFTISTIDPSAAPVLTIGIIWLNNGVMQVWDGSCWVAISEYIFSTTNPQNPSVNDIWKNGNVWYEWDGLAWQQITPIISNSDPATPVLGSYWFDSLGSTLNQWNGLSWIPLLYSTVPLSPAVGTKWYNTLTNILMEWTGTWVEATTLVTVTLTTAGDLLFTRNLAGSLSCVFVEENTNVALGFRLFNILTPHAVIQESVPGTDAVPSTPMTEQYGVGTDYSNDERLHLGKIILRNLGHPVVQVELTDEKLNDCIDNALEALRQMSDAAYSRVLFFMKIKPGVQKYLLTDKNVGFNRVVDIIKIYRQKASFLGHVTSDGVYSQSILQELYQLGTFDLISYHLASSYMELIRDMFATEIMFKFNEHTRELHTFQRFVGEETILLEAVAERTEQELMRDRITHPWIERWATAEARMALAEIRGKYATLPSASGGTSLNASELSTKAAEDFAECKEQISSWVVSNFDQWGGGSGIVIG